MDISDYLVKPSILFVKIIDFTKCIGNQRRIRDIICIEYPINFIVFQYYFRILYERLSDPIIELQRVVVRYLLLLLLEFVCYGACTAKYIQAGLEIQM